MYEGRQKKNASRRIRDTSHIPESKKGTGNLIETDSERINKK